MVETARSVIRTATRQDLEQVIALNRSSLPENYTPQFFDNLLSSYGELFLIAEEDGYIVGYVMCRIELGVSMMRAFGVVKKGHVVSIAVERQHRMRGIGYALMQEVLKRMKASKLKECFLEVRATNEPAIKLYEKLGFRVARRASGYYSDGTDGLMMVLSL